MLRTEYRDITDFKMRSLPKRHKLTHCCQHLVRLEWFDQIAAYPMFNQTGNGIPIVMGSDHDHRQVGMYRPQAAQGVQAVDFRHIDIEADKVGKFALDGFKSIHSVSSLGNNGNASSTQNAPEQRPNGTIVVHEDATLLG